MRQFKCCLGHRSTLLITEGAAGSRDSTIYCCATMGRRHYLNYGTIHMVLREPKHPSNIPKGTAGPRDPTTYLVLRGALINASRKGKLVWCLWNRSTLQTIHTESLLQRFNYLLLCYCEASKLLHSRDTSYGVSRFEAPLEQSKKSVGALLNTCFRLGSTV